ncbi:MAG: DUF1572 family protein [Gemmataceae bacterium]
MTSVDQHTIGEAVLAEGRRRLRVCAERVRHCVQQLDDTQLWWRPHEEMNSIANILLHLCGNLRQWVIAGVAETPDTRDRPREFAERGPIAKTELWRRFEEAVGKADATLAEFDASRLLEPRRIQGFDETVLSAIADSLAHLAGHTQEIIYITRWQLGPRYQFHWRPASAEQGAG